MSGRWWRGAVPADPPAATPAPAVDLRETNGRLNALTREVAALRALLQQQGEFTVDALRLAGWQSPDEIDDQVALQKALRVVDGTGDVIVGPWTGEVGFEVLYWIPFLNWLVGQGLDPKRLVVVSRGGAAPWYRHLTERYVDVLDLLTPDDFRERTSGPKKQTKAGRQLDRDLVEAVRSAHHLGEARLVHPSVMYRLFAGLFRKRATIDLVQSLTAPRPFVPASPWLPDERPAGVPADYLAAKFYFSKAFPDNSSNRAFVANVLRRVSATLPVVLLSTTVRLDEHSDFQAGGGADVFVVDAHRVPQANLALQTRIIQGARGFIGTYGGFSYVAPFLGVPSLSFFSRREGFESHHLQLADRTFDGLLPGGFVALDCRAVGLVEPAMAGWPKGPAAARHEERLTT